MDTFSGYHPLINFTYFVIVIGLSMFYMHPVFLALSLIGSVSYSIYLKGRKTVKVFLLGMLPVCLLAAAANPLFSHAGATMLFYLKDGNPVTLESIVYGLASGLMLAGVISWFSVFHEVMTSDKFDHDNLGTGKQCGDGRFDEVTGLRASREDELQHLPVRPEGRDVTGFPSGGVRCAVMLHAPAETEDPVFPGFYHE